jgi:hypothetical protein
VIFPRGRAVRQVWASLGLRWTVMQPALDFGRDWRTRIRHVRLSKRLGWWKHRAK